MKISKIKNIKEKGDLILLTRGGEKLEPYIPDQKQLRYVREKLTQEKETILLNQLDQIIIVVRFKREDTPKNLRLELARKAGFSSHTSLQQYDIESVNVINCGVEAEETIAFSEGLALTSYQFLKYRTGEDIKRNKLKEILLYDDQLSDDNVEKLANLVTGVYYTRDLVNEPLSFLNAIQLSAEIEKMGQEAGFSVEVFNKKKIESLKMGGLLAVNKGSIDPPTFSILSWKPDGAVNSRPIVLVGKGVVYDTGGMNIKTGSFMNDMKTDMAGGAAVSSALYAIAKARLPVHVIALVPATDNRTNGNAYVNGDIITMFDGTKVEVINTDAEGRMLLADALSYAKKYDPELVIDVATLTGSALRAIGTVGIVAMQVNASVEFNKLKQSGEKVYERLVEFPMWKEYREELNSEIADIKHLGGTNAGSITAAKFLEHFTGYPYIHLDIAGPAFFEKGYRYRSPGGSGIAVRLLFDFIKNKAH